MPDQACPGDDREAPSPLDVRLRSIEAARAPGDLLDRCLATIPPEAPAVPERIGRTVAWKIRVAAVAAAVLLIASVGIVVRPKDADAAHLLKAAQAAWTKVPSSHEIVRRRGPEGTRTEESWFVRDKGLREEVRVGNELIAVIVNNNRWEFRWDVRERLVAAWSAPLVNRNADPVDAGLVTGSEALLQWAESHRAEVQIQPDELAGREVRKIALRWPGPSNSGSMAQSETFWFDRDSHLPLRHRIEFSDGLVIETAIDYPAPGAVADDLFSFSPPIDVVLEINDPDLGRQIYSDGHGHAHTPNVDLSNTKGARK